MIIIKKFQTNKISALNNPYGDKMPLKEPNTTKPSYGSNRLLWNNA